MRKFVPRFTAIALLLLAACSKDVAGPDATLSPDLAPSLSLSAGSGSNTYVIVGRSERLPADLATRVNAAGGTLTRTHPEIGVAFAVGSSSSFATQLAAASGIESVTRDMLVQWTPPVRVADEIVDESAPQAEVASAGDNETFFSFQWAPTAIQAPEAWNAGYTGQNVRVAILDGGIHNTHVDLAGNLDVAASRSFVPGTAYNQDVGTFWHGTHVAGIVAAADNGIGTIGVAPSARLIGVKVLHNGTGEWNYLIEGIMYASKSLGEGGAGAQVINMSLGGTFNEDDPAIRDAVRELKKALDRATKYAHKRRVTVIASAGNGGLNLDVRKELLKLPAQNKHVMSVSATGPTGWAYRNATNFFAPAYYTDHGKSLVDVAAPGGTAGLFVVEDVDALCTKVGTFRTIVNFCEVFDMVMSTVRGGATSTSSYNWAQGTSMAAPMVSGIAALVIQRNGGSLHPDKVMNIIEQSSLDLGTPGRDIFYGRGWVNALRAVQKSGGDDDDDGDDDEEGRKPSPIGTDDD